MYRPRLACASAAILLFMALASLLVACDFAPDATSTVTPPVSTTPRTRFPLPPPTSLTTLDIELTLSASPSSRSSVSPPSGTPLLQKDDAGTQADAYLNGLVVAGQFSGAVLLARDGKVLLSKGYGLADIENGVPNTERTAFRIASLTKQFTAAGILLLQGEGKLGVQDSVCRFVENCPISWQPMTIEDLLLHTSGLPPDPSLHDQLLLMQAANPISAGLKLIQSRPLTSVPGTTFAYSNTGYDLLGYIIQRASGRSYEAYLREKIWQPLGMTSTGQDHEGLLVKNRARGYANPTTAASYVPIELAASAGGLYSTVEDLSKWDQALYTGKILPQSALDVMFTPHNGDYGYGWTIKQDKYGKLVAHSGNISGFVSQISRYPSSHTTIIILSNLESAPMSRIAAELTARVFGEK